MVIEVNKINWGKSITVGITAGLVAGLVKLGWENILPPRTPERDQTNPPQKMLEQFGVPTQITHATYTYSGQQLPWVSYVVHFSFSAGFGVLYSIGGQLAPWIKKVMEYHSGLLFGISSTSS